MRYTLNFPSTEENNQAAVFNLETQQLEFLGATASRARPAQLHKLNFGPRARRRRPDRPTRPSLRTGYGLVWIEMAGITTPFTTPVFPFLQTVSQRTLDNITPAFTLATGPSVEPIPLTPDAGLGQGVFSVDRDLGSGYVQQWNASLQRELTPNISIEVAYVGSKITRVGIPDTNLNQLTAEQLAQGTPLLQRVPIRYFGIIPRSSSLGDPTITGGAAAEAVSRVHDRQPVPQQRRHDASTTASTSSWSSGFSRGLSYLVSYTRSKLMDDASSVFDASILTGPVANFPVADSFNRHARARLLDRRHSARLRRVGGLGPSVRREPAPAATGVRRRARQRLDADRRADAAVGHAARDHADDQQQRVRRIRHAAAEPDRRSDAARRRADRRAAGSTPPRSPPRRSSRSASSSRNPVRGPGLPQSRSGADAPRAAVGEHGARSCAPRSST